MAVVAQLSLLGGLEFKYAGKSISIPVAGQRLLAFLALHDWHQHRCVVAGTLWTDVGEERAAARLRTALWRIRRIGAGLISSEGPYLCIDRGIRVDLTDLVGATRRLMADPFAAGEPPVTAAMLGLDLLPQWHEDWVVIERERLRQLRMHGLEALCRRLSTQGRHASAIDAGMRAVQIEPLRETAQRVLIAAHLGDGNVAEAVRQYRSFRGELREHLGIEPGPEIRALFEKVQLASSR
ncbi:AfsR/SARP family transcriptional regulator [Actinoplanes sp. CA-142083]|uniref:AfsR/SARP family transcriptional regulator n=1 Tax=Actinoplanes sp. CA-142083 TaxID=3239903 RepID=UPI003D90D22C